MNIITELERYGTLFNEETLESILKPVSARINLQDSFLEEQRVFYYTLDSRSIRDYSFHDSDKASFKIVKFTNTRNFFNHPWAFGFIKEETEKGVTWRGAYAGIHGELFSKIKKVLRSKDNNKILNSKVNFPRAITRVDLFEKFDGESVAQELYKNLVDKKEWDVLGGISGLKTYLENLIYVVRDKALFQKSSTEEFKLEYNKKKVSIIFNTGLLDKYFNFLIVKVNMSLHSTSLLYEPYYTVTSALLLENLSEYDIRDSLSVVKMCEKESMVFPSDKIVLNDRQGLDHIFTERYNRLSLELQKCSPEVLYSSLEYSVNLALKLSKIDIQYLVPFLNMKWNKVSYLMPFYVKHIDSENPLCAIVIGEISKGVWAPVTTLRLETARSNARLLGRLNSPWLINKKGGIVYENCES